MNEIELLIVGEDNETHKLQCSQAFYGALLVMTGRQADMAQEKNGKRHLRQTVLMLRRCKQQLTIL